MPVQTNRNQMVFLVATKCTLRGTFIQILFQIRYLCSDWIQCVSNCDWWCSNVNRFYFSILFNFSRMSSLPRYNISQLKLPLFAQLSLAEILKSNAHMFVIRINAPIFSLITYKNKLKIDEKQISITHLILLCIYKWSFKVFVNLAAGKMKVLPNEPNDIEFKALNNVSAHISITDKNMWYMPKWR